MGQDSMGRVWNKVGVSGEAFWFVLGHVDQDLMDNIDRGTVDKNFHGGCGLFALILAIWDVAGDKVNFNVETFVFYFFVNECFHCVTMVHHGREFAHETSQGNIVGGEKATFFPRKLE